MNEEQKGIIEYNIFKEFSIKANLEVELGSIRKELPPNPDISCNINGRGKVWFELTEACAPEYKQAINDFIKKLEKSEELNSSMLEFPVVWGGDVSVQTAKNKIKKKYPVSGDVELLLYTNGMTAMNDEMLEAEIQPILVNGAGQFCRVWLFGDGVHQLWPVE